MTAYEIQLPCPHCGRDVRCRVTFTDRPVTPMQPRFAAQAHRCTAPQEDK